ncbi:MAG: hypothetical protein KKD73_08520 [Proteobacteria bacterium]|nr:hypothetical protein [Pseudomonadota bacterium]MBU1641416.1 hypothetical protein [Pseudomonadota bacterium]
MTSLVAYHFPETDITVADVHSQLLFFSQIFHLTPLEQESGEPDELCPAYTPAPLGDDLVRFKQLLAELKGNEAAFYQGRLSNLALEYMENRDPKTVQAIISNLHKPGTSAASASEVTSARIREELWQARLLLKLAEILRQEEKVLAEGLASLEERQAELFQALKGEDLDDLLQSLTATARPKFPVRIESLIKAWGRLLLAGDRQPWFVNCFSGEAAEPFFEVNENISGQRPVRLLRLPLPDCSQDVDNYHEKRQLWLESLADCRQKIATLLQDIASHGLGPTSLADLTQLAAQWTKSSDQGIWPESPALSTSQKNCATPHLEIYLLNKSIPELLSKLCAQKNPPEPVGPWRHGLLAVLSSRSSTCKG